MNHPTDDGAGCTGSLCLARNGLGGVTACGCGAITLTVGCLSLRLDAAAFAELAELVGRAQPRLARLAGCPAQPQPQTPADDGPADACVRAAPLH